MNILITGATGTIGTELIRQLTAMNYDGKIYAMARNEARMAALKARFPAIRPIYGDITDKERVRRAMLPADIVIHAAAMKRVDACEYDKLEAVKVNIEGTKNLVLSAEENEVKTFCYLNTDKAVEPITFYGFTKAIAERLVLSFDRSLAGGMKCFSCRYGNVWGSTGSVYHIFKEAAINHKPLFIREPKATRFFWRIEEAARFILYSIFATKELHGFETQGYQVLIPDMKSLRIAELAEWMIEKYGGGHGEIEYGDGFKEYPEKIHEKLDENTCSEDFVQTGNDLTLFMEELTK